MKTFAFLIVIFIVVGFHETAFSQEKEDTRRWVGVYEAQVPSSRLDSLTKLREAYDVKYKWEEKAKELGYVLDIRIMYTNDVWNYRVEYVYPSWEAMHNPGWRNRTWEALEPDSAKRAAINAGYGWVMKDVIGRSRIYRIVNWAP